MPAVPTRPLLALYVAWHPAFLYGAELAEILRAHFRRDLFGSVAGGTGLSVLYRSDAPSGNPVPLDIDPEGAESTAVVILADAEMAGDEDWCRYVAGLSDKADAEGLRMRLLPVAFHRSALSVAKEQAVRYDSWSDGEQAKNEQLISELTLELCRMLRHFLAHLDHPGDPVKTLDQYLEPVRIFLSHSKHNGGGERIAIALRGQLHHGKGLASFFDVNDIPAGLRFDEVLLHRVRQSAVVAIHTDSYSSREWCRREIIEAKKFTVPLVVANCIGDRDERGFPYLGNVPIVRMNPDRMDRLPAVVGRILDEVLKDFLWKCRVRVANTKLANVTFVPRPPELITLTALPDETIVPNPVLVYPDPPLSREEQRLFEIISPRVELRSMTEWLAETA